jgi:polyisoprenoid-binding protein YceI
MSILALFMLGQGGWASPIAITDGHVHFLAVGRPAMIKINGEGQSLSGQIDEQAGKVSGTFQFDLTGLQTGIELRDRHMKEKYLEVGRFKSAQLAFDSVAIPAAADPTQSTELRVPARLNLHGQEHPVEVNTKIKRTADGYEGHGQFSLKLSDFGVEIPVYLGIKVADQVDVTVEFKGRTKTP